MRRTAVKHAETGEQQLWAGISLNGDVDVATPIDPTLRTYALESFSPW
ncbi:hypothetical protein [Rhizobium mongolense]